MLRIMPIAPMDVRQPAFQMPRGLLVIYSWRPPDLRIHRTRLRPNNIQAESDSRVGLTQMSACFWSLHVVTERPLCAG